MRRTGYTVFIERLVLDGLDLTPQEAEQMRQALVDELAHRLREAGPPPVSGVVELEKAALPPLSRPGARMTDHLVSGMADQISQMLSGDGMTSSRR